MNNRSTSPLRDMDHLTATGSPTAEIVTPASGMRFTRAESAAVADKFAAAQKRIARLEGDLAECQEYFASRMDVVDGDYGEPAPNREMQLHSMIDETLNGRPI